MRQRYPDEVVGELARLFLEHPAWIEAGSRIREGASSNVYFRHRPGEGWTLVRRAGESRLEPGPDSDPDFVFRFTPASVQRLAAVRGGVGDFAVALFSLIVEEDAAQRVEFRVAAPFLRLVRRGYLALLLSAGPKVVAFGAARGVRTLAALREQVRASRTRGPFDWEA